MRLSITYIRPLTCPKFLEASALRVEVDNA